MSRRRLTAIIAFLLATGVALTIGTAYRRDLDRARLRIEGRSQVVATSAGPLEYALAGEGPPLLMIHGTGGGFDQGLSFSEKVAARGVRVIAPSRFGYLRSSFPRDASSERQADALVDLLDRLGVKRVAVAGGSAGALSAAHLALRHPERVSVLILIVPAANVDGRDPNAMSPAQQWLVRQLLTSDLAFWMARQVAAKAMIGVLLATDPALLDRVSDDERARAYRVLDQILPISARWRGMLNDAQLAGNPARMDFAALKVPTLVISARDDRFGTAPTATAIARSVPGAQLEIYPDGGHILLGHDDEAGALVARFVREHAAR